MAEKIWNKFEKEIKKLVSNIDNSVLKKLKTSFTLTPIHFLTSNDCQALIKDTIEKISFNKIKVYIHLLDFKKSLKEVHKVKRKIPTEPVVVSKRRKLIEDVDSDENVLATVKDEEKEFLDYYNNCTTETKKTSVIEATVVDEPVSENQSKVDKYILRLENILELTKSQIEKLEEEELSLDDLEQENSAFMMLDKLKLHYIKVWRKICKLRNTSSQLRRKQLKSFTFKGTIYLELNQIIEDFIKAKKFPDYHDIKKLVTTFVKNKSMKMNDRQMRELSVDIFTQIGNQLKKLRIGDFVKYFGNHLTDQVKANENPILTDENLKRVLIRSYNVGQLKLDDVIDKFSKIEQSNINKEEDNISDISTEQSVISDNDDIDENLDEIILEHLENETNIDLEDKTDSHEEIEEEEESVKEVEKVVTPSNISKDPIETNTNIFPVPPPLITRKREENKTVNGTITQYCDISVKNSSMPVEHPAQDKIIPFNDFLSSQKINTEEQIKDMKAHTFQFNLEQIRHGSNGAIIPATIVINSSDESESDSSDDVEELEDNNYAYSSKLDDFCIVKLKKKECIDTGIFINLDDSDDCDS